VKAARLVHCLLSIVGLVAANNYQTIYNGVNNLVSIRLELLGVIFLPRGHYNSLGSCWHPRNQQMMRNWGELWIQKRRYDFWRWICKQLCNNIIVLDLQDFYTTKDNKLNKSCILKWYSAPSIWTACNYMTNCSVTRPSSLRDLSYCAVSCSISCP